MGLAWPSINLLLEFYQLGFKSSILVVDSFYRKQWSWVIESKTRLLTIWCIEIAFGNHGIKVVKCSQEHFISIISSFLKQNRSKDSALDAILFRTKLLLERLFINLTELITDTYTRRANQKPLCSTSFSIVPAHRINNKIITMCKC